MVIKVVHRVQTLEIVIRASNKVLELLPDRVFIGEELSIRVFARMDITLYQYTRKR